MGEGGSTGDGGGTKWKHPLVEKNPKPIASWSRWLELWNAAETKEELAGLLHCGFDVPADGTYSDRIIFYLDIADGFGGYSNFDGGSRGAELQKLATRAMMTLCDKVFAKQDATSRDLSQDHRHLVVCPEIFARLMDFFDGHLAGDNFHWTSLDNPLRDYQRENVSEFLVRLFRYAWVEFDQDCHWELNQDSPRYDKARKVSRMFFEARPRLLRILGRLGKLDILVVSPSSPSFINIGKEGMTELRRIALATPRFGPKPKTIEQAIHAGSRAAVVYLTLQIMEAEGERQKQIREAEAARAQAEAKLKKLSTPTASQ